MTALAKKPVGIMISGRGSNMQALIAAAQDPNYPARIVQVISNRPAAPGLELARAAGIPAQAIDHKAYPDRESFESDVSAAMHRAGVEIIAQAGFMRILTAGFVQEWAGRMINIHPSLLPLFPGLHTHRRALDAGVKIHGCSVHFVSEGVDQGALIGQAAVAVHPADTADALAARVLQAEHKLYPRCLALVCRSDVVLTADGARLPPGTENDAMLINPN